MKTARYIREKKGYYYTALPAKDKNGKKTTKWERTGLKVGVEGNEALAQQMLEDRQRKEQGLSAILKPSMLFSDFMKYWLSTIKSTVKETTFASYKYAVENVIVPYFEKKKIALDKLRALDIDTFYTECRESGKKVSASTIKHYHANIHKALKYAFTYELVSGNVADAVQLPSVTPYVADYYNAEETRRLLDVIEECEFKVPIYLAVCLGMRRSEVIGLRWKSIDFDNNTIKVEHTITTPTVDGKRILVKSNVMKRKKSRRTYPMPETLSNLLFQLQERQKENLEKLGDGYNKDFLGYVCVDDEGNLIQPDYITKAFPALVEKNGLRRICFHALRHTNATLLLANSTPMFDLKSWLGHSDIRTSDNIYGHAEFASKVKLAKVMENVLGKTDTNTNSGIDLASMNLDESKMNIIRTLIESWKAGAA